MTEKYTSKQLENIIEKQLTDKERSAIFLFSIGYNDYYNDSKFCKAINSALDNLSIISKISAEAK